MRYTIVATSYNDADSIERYLDDMVKQSLVPDEIIIADGGSKDDTVVRIHEYQKKTTISIRCVSGKRLNISEGYNTAIKAAKTEYIGISGIGNRYDRDYYECLNRIDDFEQFDVIYSPIRGYNANKFSEKYNNVILNGEVGQCLSIASNHGALVKKSVFENLGYFYEKFIYAGEDGEFYSLVKDKGLETAIVKEAKVYWETPASWKEFLKQIRVYTIADMQINSEKQWTKLKPRICKVIMAAICVLGICLLMCGKGMVWLKALALIIATSIIMIKRNKLNSLVLARSYLPIFYTIKYRKYMKEEFAVRREEV